METSTSSSLYSLVPARSIQRHHLTAAHDRFVCGLAALSQVVLHHISIADVANLRQVSCKVSMRTTQHMPYIQIRLSRNSTQEYVNAWSQTTKGLQHVQTIHIHMVGRIAPDLFESAMQVLSQRGVVKELHLLGVRSHHRDTLLGESETSCTACLPSLVPLCCVLGTLKTLVVKDLMVGHVADDMQKMAQKASRDWQLHNLTLHLRQAIGTVSDMLHLSVGLVSAAQAFPHLQRYDIDVSGVRCSEDIVLNNPDTKELDAVSQRHNQLLTTALAAAMAGSVRQLQQLKDLRVTGLPDPWSADTTPSAALLAAWLPPQKYEDVSPAVLDILQSVPFAEAAEALCVMENLGCWLLQQQQSLQQFLLGCGHWNMTWQQQRDKQQKASSSQGCATRNYEDSLALTAPQSALTVTPAARVCAGFNAILTRIYRLQRSGAVHPRASNTILQHQFLRSLSYYSPQPTSVLMHTITSCHLTLCHEQLGDNSLAQLLRLMSSLKELKARSILQTLCKCLHRFDAGFVIGSVPT